MYRSFVYICLQMQCSSIFNVDVKDVELREGVTILSVWLIASRLSALGTSTILSENVSQ
jgi:hypothetical protein